MKQAPVHLPMLNSYPASIGAHHPSTPPSTPLPPIRKAYFLLYIQFVQVNYYLT